MEETVRSLLQNQGGVLEQTAVDTVDIMKAYKVGLSPVHLSSSSGVFLTETCVQNKAVITGQL